MKNRKISYLILMFCIMLTSCRNATDNAPAKNDLGNPSISMAADGKAVRYIPEFQILPYSLEVRQAYFYNDDIYFLMCSSDIYDPTNFQAEIYKGNANNLQLEKIEIPLSAGETILRICVIGDNTANRDSAIYLATGNAETRVSDQEEIYTHILKASMEGVIQETFDISDADQIVTGSCRRKVTGAGAGYQPGNYFTDGIGEIQHPCQCVACLMRFVPYTCPRFFC